MNIISTKDAQSHGLKMLIYGQAGAGKTYLAATCPEMPLIISAEAGLLSLSGFHIPAVVVNNLHDLEDIYKFLQKDSEYSWIILDSISEIAEQVLEFESAKKTKDGNPVGLSAYNELFKQVKAICKQFRDLPGKNVLFTAKVERQKDEISGAMLLCPSMPGKALTGAIPYLFDEVFYLATSANRETGETERWLQTQGDFQVAAKDRSGRLDRFEPADLSHIAKKIAG